MANERFMFMAWIASLNKMVYSDDYETMGDFFNDIYPLNHGKDNFMFPTGLKENFNESPSLNKYIYEGDIVEFLDGLLSVVVWNDDTCEWQYSDGTLLNNGERYSCYKRIAGNLYEHPHLLTSKL